MIESTGVKGYKEMTVTAEHTAKQMGSGQLAVFATPAMIALIEHTAWDSVADLLDEGESTVGIRLEIDHISATPIGMKVRCETTLTAIDRRRLTFEANVFDENGLVGQGTHERFIVNNEKFMKKLSDN